MDHWNELVAIMNSDKAKQLEYTTYEGKSISWAAIAKMNLEQLNTASGAQLKPSIECFVNNYNHILTYNL